MKKTKEKNKLFRQNPLTNGEVSAIISKSYPIGNLHIKKLEKISKKVKKLSKKVLTNGK